MWGWFPWRRTAVRKRIVVNLADKAFAGVLWAKRGPLLILKDAVLMQHGAADTPMDGEVLIERVKVEFIQVAGGG
ncbi:hypothetical protein [Streptomyces racemochromogenes]|uniref:hypothetical protein n=1 Tax=Streptomyces racemochromogenes TaxID=67353 RepID=UPI0031E7F353